MSVLGLRPSPPAFRDRRDAGRRLAERLRPLAAERPVVLGLPRGGVPVAYEIALALNAPLDVLLVRKVGCPVQPELGVGAVGEDGTLVLDHAALAAMEIPREDVEPTVRRERAELERRRAAYRGGREPLSVAGRTVILVDDGVATGGTAWVGATILRHRGADRVVLAVPVGPPGVAERFRGPVDQVVCLEQPAGFFAVGQAYERFPQTTDEEVSELLAAARDGLPPDPGPDEPAVPPAVGGLGLPRLETRRIEIPADGLRLPGDLRVPAVARGLVLFAHGSGSSRHSPRNMQVAAALNAHGHATLLFDLLVPREAADRHAVFDVDLLAGRLVAATHWAAADGATSALSLGYMGASTGAAAALVAAARLPGRVRAVVSRGGRPDLAERWLQDLAAPTLLIVGGDDPAVLELNQRATARLRCPHELTIVPGATHLFEEPGALAHVTELAAAWFGRHLTAAAASAP